MSQKNTGKEEMEMNFTVHLFISTVFEFIARVADCDYEAKLLENKLGRALQCKWGFSPCKIISPGRCYMDTQYPPRSREIIGANDIKGTGSAHAPV